MINGYAMLIDSENYFLNKNIPFKSCNHFYCSPIAMGTHLGDFSDEDSNMYIETLVYGLENGINFIDTAVNYRGMRSEVDIGKALHEIMNVRKTLTREEFIISTKGGQIFGDCLKEIPPIKYIDEILIKENILKREDINILESGRHTLNPNFYEYSIEKSRKNLGIDTIDIHYIHNPEISRYVLGEERFYNELSYLISFYENQVEIGNIRFYGMATWDAFISDINSPWYISLEKVIHLLKEVVGENHHFKFIQLPYNIINTKGKTLKNQKFQGELYSAIDVANKLGLNVTISSPLNEMNGITSPKEALDFVINTEGVFATMIGMQKKEHLLYNIDYIN